MRKIIIVLLLFATGYMTAQENHKNSISVSGEGIVKVTPDQVVLNIRVEHTANTAAEAKKMNDIVVNSVLQFCRKMKLATKDIHTQYMNLNKNYDYKKKEYHYKANQAIRVLLRDLDKYEPFIQGLLDAGINRIDGVTFKNSQQDKYESEARTKAIQNAKQKAEEYTKALQQSVGKAITISESSTNHYPTPRNRGMYMKDMAMAIESNDNEETIALGEMMVSAKVQVTFELK